MEARTVQLGQGSVWSYIKIAFLAESKAGGYVANGPSDSFLLSTHFLCVGNQMA